MAKRRSIFAICTVLCCLNLPIYAFNRTKSFTSEFSNKNEIEPLFARSKDRLFAISFESNTIIMIAIDGGNESNLCPLSTSMMDAGLGAKKIKSLGNGKIVISARSGIDEHLRGMMHSYIIVDPFDCSTLVEFKSFGGLVVPYYDSFDIVYLRSLGLSFSPLKPQRYNDKGKVIKLDKQIDAISSYQHYGAPSPTIQSIEPFDGSEGYLSHGEKLIRLDSEMKQLADYSLHGGQKISIDYGRATTCYPDSNGSYVCDLLDADLKVQATVKLNNLKEARLHTVHNLPNGGAVVVRSTHIPDITSFHGTVIHPDGRIFKSDILTGFTARGETVQGFVLSTGEFCIVVFYKNLGLFEFDFSTLCVDLTI